MSWEGRCVSRGGEMCELGGSMRLSGVWEGTHTHSLKGQLPEHTCISIVCVNNNFYDLEETNIDSLQGGDIGCNTK